MPFQELPFNGDTFVCNEFLKLKELYNLNVAVETGSCLYSTTKWLGENFEKVHTVEINAEYAKAGVEKVLAMPNVKPEINDSVTYLKNLQLAETDRAIFFLDAHWGQNCPLIEEMDAIANMKLKYPPIIVIHDFFTGDANLGWDEYNGQRFDYDWIEPKVSKMQSAYGHLYRHYFNMQAEGAKRGVIYLVPDTFGVKVEIQSAEDESPDEAIKFHPNSLAELVEYVDNRIEVLSDEKLERIKYENIVNKVDKWFKYSQSGEEAYIQYLLSVNRGINNHLVEIGAWDGFHLSNTRFLIEKNWTHLLIDGDNHGNTEVKKHFVTKENILEILSSYNTPKEFDFLSIDVDGNDLYILEEILTQYFPTLIVAEFNPIWQSHESKVITYDPTHTWNNDDYYGFSFLAGKKMAAKYGYSCVFQNDSLNMYFVKNAPEMNVQYDVKNYHPHSSKNSWIDY
jgi:hypothetical protein